MTDRKMPLTHPGASIRDSIEAMGWTVTECAQRLGTPRENGLLAPGQAWERGKV